MTNYTEAKDEARRLTRVLGRDVEVKPIICSCDYNKLCGSCGGEGIYYDLVFTYCNHSVGDGELIECHEDGCLDRERDPSGALVLKAEGPQIPGCANSEQEEMEVA